MDAALFAKMLTDKSVLDWRKLGRKFPEADLREFAALLKNGFYRPLPLQDFDGGAVVYLESVAQVRLSAARVLLTPQNSGRLYGIQAMEEEILSTLAIEHIDTSRDSVRRVLSGCAPVTESENRVYGMKKGLEYLADPQNTISEESIHALYELTVAPFLPEEDCLQPGRFYRHDSVFVVGGRVEHTGLPWRKLPDFMGALVDFINGKSDMNDLLKAALIHFYIAYLHPWFDGNGRMARLMHLWYLVQRRYSSALFIPLSEYVENSRQSYYRAYTLTEQNARISGVLDVTPFLVYFIENVYHRLTPAPPAADAMAVFQNALEQGRVTAKEDALWRFVLAAYGGEPFSTKQLEKDFGSAAYATIRGFVLKFEQLGLLRSARYGSRVKYRAEIGNES